MKKIISLFIILTTGVLFSQETDQSMQQMYMELAQPGDEHDWLSKYSGNWEQNYKFYSAPGAPPVESTGKATAEMILGNRFLKSTATGNMMGMDVESISILGFDKRFKKFTLDGYDTMGTYGIHAEGVYLKDSKTLRFRGKNYEPAMKEYVDYTMKFVFHDENSYSVELVFHFPNGNDMKIMEIESKRI